MVRRFLYDAVGRIALREHEWHLMNYGFAPEEGDTVTPEVTATAEERFGLLMYQRVVGPYDLTNQDVLEIGCGRGGGAAYIARHFGPQRLLALDFAPQLVQLCQRSHQSPNLEFQVGNAMDLGLEDEAFDNVINVESSHCYNDKPAFWSEVRRVLRPGGHFHYTDVFRPKVWQRTLRQLRKMGFEIEDEEDVTPGVLRAINEDASRRQRLIERYTPFWLRHEAAAWAGLPGSAPYQNLEDGTHPYVRCVARRA